MPRGINKKQFDTGRKIESEHANTYLKIKRYAIKHKKWPPEEFVYAWICEDHLKGSKNEIAIPDYYSRLIKMEKQAREEINNKKLNNK